MQTGLNTLLLSGSTSPVPDVVALAASGDPGIVDIAGANGTGAFAVATVNLGADATISASANTGTATLPVTLAKDAAVGGIEGDRAAQSLRGPRPGHCATAS
jgi:hypothetical protein